MFTRLRQSGFSLIELLITIATVSALSGIGLAVYAQYQQRAYNSSALQQGMNLRTSFEAGLADRSALGSTVFANSPALEFAIDGTLSCVSGCDDITPSSLFPGYVAGRGVKIFFDLFDSTQSYQIQVGHCKALTSDSSSYDGWRVSDQQASDRVAIPADSGEVSQCAAVLAGGGVADSCGYTDTPCDGWIASGNRCTSNWDGNSCVEDCSNCPAVPVCGDGSCEGDEVSGSNCLADCSVDICGDGQCNGSENDSSCAADCSVCGDGYCGGGEDPMTCDADCGGVCGDASCHPLEESSGSCPADCPVCGDGDCGTGEDSISCIADCPGTCGDTMCSSSETTANCYADCGSMCGDGTCNGSETDINCPTDCF